MTTNKSILQRVRSRLEALILFPFLLPPFFVLHRARHYSYSIPSGDVLELSGMYLFGAAVTYGTIRLLTRRKVAAGIATFLLLILFFYWWEILPPLSRILHSGLEMPAHLLLLCVCLGVVVAIAFIVAKQKEATGRKIVFYLNALLIIYVSIEVMLPGIYTLTGSMQHPLINQQVSRQEDATEPHAGKDIYLLLFDEYASGASLQKDWQFDNRDIEAYLTGRGFNIARGSHSNYNLTPFSMASMLNMDYLQGYTKPVNIVDERDYQYCIAALERPRVVSVLQRAGYAFTAYGIFNIAGQQRTELDGRLVFERRLITNHTFYQLLKEYYFPYLAFRKAAMNHQQYYDSTLYRSHNYNIATLQKLLQKIKNTNSRPQFIYAHFMLPHPPFYYDSTGALLPVNETAADKKEGYRNNVKQANRVIRQIVDSIHKSSDGNAVILIMGDHGHRLNYKQFPQQSFPNFNAVYFPDKDYSAVSDSMTNVNLFRIVLNKCCGMHYQLLPGKNYFLKDN